MERQIQNKLDACFSIPRTKIRYPYLYIKEPSDELAVFCDGLPGGDLPLVIPFDDKLERIAEVGRTPKTICVLLRLYTLTMVFSEGEYLEFSNIEELLKDSRMDWRSD